MRLCQLLSACAVLLVAVAGTVHGSLITITSDISYVIAHADSLGGTASQQQQLSFDGQDHSISTTSGASSSTTTTNYSTNIGQAFLSTTASQTWVGGLSDYGFSYAATVFKADEANLAYTLDGSYSNVGSSGASPYTLLVVRLFDVTAGQVLFENRQESTGTFSESFQLGQTGGDYYNVLVGSLTGALIAGHQYEWSRVAQTSALGVAGNGATASGWMTLTITQSSPVPEPASLALCGVGTLGLICGFRRRRS